MFGARVSNDGAHLFLNVRKASGKLNMVYHADLTNESLDKEI